MGWLLAVLGLVAALLIGRRVYRAWVARLFRTSLTDAIPSFQVEVLDAPEGRTRVRVVLGAATEPIQVTALSAPREAAREVRLEAPRGFSVEPAPPGSATARWIAASPPVALAGTPLEFDFGYDPGTSGTVAVFGHAESAKSPGRSRCGFTVLVGLRDPVEIDRANRRSALFARAREMGVPPTALPEWSEVAPPTGTD